MAARTHTVRLSSKGQIVIPAGVRRALGLQAGRPLTVRAGRGKEIVFIPVEEGARDAETMLRRTRAWARRTRRDLVRELHERRRHEREHVAGRRRH